MFGENGKDVIKGGKGDDYLHGGNGNDTLTGGKGVDYFYISKGKDVVTDFDVKKDVLVSGEGAKWTWSQEKNDLTIKLKGKLFKGSQITLKGVNADEILSDLVPKTTLKSVENDKTIQELTSMFNALNTSEFL